MKEKPLFQLIFEVALKIADAIKFTSLTYPFEEEFTVQNVNPL